jgi:hypothetical protein
MVLTFHLFRALRAVLTAPLRLGFKKIRVHYITGDLSTADIPRFIGQRIRSGTLSSQRPAPGHFPSLSVRRVRKDVFHPTRSRCRLYPSFPQHRLSLGMRFSFFHMRSCILCLSVLRPRS